MPQTTNAPDLFDYFQHSKQMKFNDHKTITCLITEIGFINDALILGDIVKVESAIKFAQRKVNDAKKELAVDGITNSFFTLYAWGGLVSMSYEYTFPDGFSVKCPRITPTGQLRK